MSLDLLKKIKRKIVRSIHYFLFYKICSFSSQNINLIIIIRLQNSTLFLNFVNQSARLGLKRFV